MMDSTSFPTGLSMMATINSMFSIHEKITFPVDHYHAVRHYVLVNYSDSEFQKLEIPLQSLNSLRSVVEGTKIYLNSDRIVVEDPKLSDTRRRDLLIRYFKALCSAESVLPFSPQPDHISSVFFTWFNAFETSEKSSQCSLDLEKASVMFNLGAVYSQIGLSCYRVGRKQAELNFRSAAGAFAYLRDNLAVNAARGGSVTVDLSIECARVLESLMLGQASECFYHNAMDEGRITHGDCAKISRQVGEYYKEAFDGASVAPLRGYFGEKWVTQIELKAAIFRADSCFRHSLELLEKSKIGEVIERLEAGISALPDVEKFTSVREQPIDQLLTALDKVESDLNRILQRANEMKDIVYQQTVPNSCCLTSWPAVTLPKAISMEKVLDETIEDVFGCIVLDTSAEGFQKDTGTVEKMIGFLAKKLQVGSEIARERLEKMGLPESIVELEEIATLPEELKVEVEAVQVSGGQAELEDNLQQLIDSRRGLVQSCSKLRIQTKMLENEEQEVGELKDRVEGFSANLNNLCEVEINWSLKEYSTLMSILDPHRIKGVHLPFRPLVKPYISFGKKEAAIVGALKKSLSKMDIGRERSLALEERLKEIKTKDDILRKLNEQDIAEFDKINVEISENFAREHRTLVQIQEQNDILSAVFNLEDFKALNIALKEQVEAALAKYKEIKEMIDTEMMIQKDLQEILNGLKRECHAYEMPRNSDENVQQASSEQQPPHPS